MHNLLLHKQVGGGIVTNLVSCLNMYEGWILCKRPLHQVTEEALSVSELLLRIAWTGRPCSEMAGGTVAASDLPQLMWCS